MHEQELMAGVFETLTSLAGDDPIEEVEIALAHEVDRQEAIRSWKVLTHGTALEEARVIWERSLDLFRCTECGHGFTEDGQTSCPYCGSDGVVVESPRRVSLGRWITRRRETRT